MIFPSFRLCCFRRIPSRCSDMYLIYFDHVGHQGDLSFRKPLPPIVSVPAVRGDGPGMPEHPGCGALMRYSATRIVNIPSDSPPHWYRHYSRGKNLLTEEERKQVILDLLAATPYTPGMM